MVTKKKIIFLDFDGVIISSRSHTALLSKEQRNIIESIAINTRDDYVKKELLRTLDCTAVGLIRSVCEKTKAEIIISSAWRLHANFDLYAKVLDLPIIGQTTWKTGMRGREIKDWLDTNGMPERYIIIDDDRDMLKDQMQYLIQTDKDNGFLYNDYKKALELLGEEQ